jgi:hypothetical protein
MTTKSKLPKSIFFFPNGLCAVCDDKGEQIPKYQLYHHETMEALMKDGINWEDIAECYGMPTYTHQQVEKEE